MKNRSKYYIIVVKITYLLHTAHRVLRGTDVYMTENLTNINVVKSLCERYGFSFSKQYGQNFLINPSVAPRMAENLAKTGCEYVIEIGPGFGVLTRELAKRFKKVIAVELDSRLFPILDETLSGCDNVKVVEGDALKIDLSALIAEEFGGSPVCVAGNLPYYITTPIITMLLESDIPLVSVVTMVQKEVAKRLASPLGTRLCGAISGVIWHRSVPKELFSVSRGSFMPSPSVDSAVIELKIRETPPVPCDVKQFSTLVRAAFSQRRKIAVSAISSTMGVDKQALISLFEELGISQKARAEELTLEEFGRICEKLPL